MTHGEVARALRKVLGWTWPVYFLGYLLAPYVPWAGCGVRERAVHDLAEDLRFH